MARVVVHVCCFVPGRFGRGARACHVHQGSRKASGQAGRQARDGRGSLGGRLLRETRNTDWEPRCHLKSPLGESGGDQQRGLSFQEGGRGTEDI